MIATVLLVALVVVLAAVVGGAVLILGDGIAEPTPTVARSTGTFVPQDGTDGGIVRIEHEAGDTVRVADLEVVVDAQRACGKTGRIVNLPLGAGNHISPDQIEGDDVFDGRSVNNYADEPVVLLREQRRPGERLTFRIPKTDCEIRTGDRIEVRVVHLPSDAVIISETLSA